MRDNAPPTEMRDLAKKEEFRRALRVCCSRMSLPLYMVFWFADLIYAPQLKWDFLVLRSLMIPINLLIFHRASQQRTLRELEHASLAFAFANANLITIMIFLTEGVHSPYYAGLNLVAVGILAFFPWSKRSLPWAVGVIFGPYYLGVLFTLELPGDLAPLALNSFFIIGTVIASLVKYRFTETLRMDELAGRLRLQEEVRSREEIIARKTEEALNLAELTKQFSPQVVQAIRSGDLVLSESQHSQICAIFIDIVDSTDHVVRLDINEVSTVISMFMEDTVKILLKYDITIDKFVGDGILAFANAPVEHADYAERVVAAALEIQERLRNRRVIYAEHWRDEFRVRMGIASGTARVGFYGSVFFFRSYTALGAVVNLACRLCGEAAPNQILVSEPVAEAVSHLVMTAKLAVRPRLKGFESQSISVYEILTTGRMIDASPEVCFCPNAHGVLHLDTTESNIYVFKCRECGYILTDTRAAETGHSAGAAA